jgi:hypothetical protein
LPQAPDLLAQGIERTMGMVRSAWSAGARRSSAAGEGADAALLVVVSGAALLHGPSSRRTRLTLPSLAPMLVQIASSTEPRTCRNATFTELACSQMQPEAFAPAGTVSGRIVHVHESTPGSSRAVLVSTQNEVELARE